jgi:hypothetical protein
VGAGIAGLGPGSGLVVGEVSGWVSEPVEDPAELASNGSPKLNSDKLPVPFSAVAGLIGESGNGDWVGEGGAASVPGNGVEGFVDTGLLTSVDGFDASPIPKVNEARSLSSNRDRGLYGSYTPPLVVPLGPARAGLDGRCACNELRRLKIAESARWAEDGTPPSPEFVRDIWLEVSLS